MHPKDVRLCLRAMPLHDHPPSAAGAAPLALLCWLACALRPAVCCMAGPPLSACRHPPPRPVPLQSPRNVTGSRSGLLKCFVRRVSPSPLSNAVWRCLQPAAPHWASILAWAWLAGSTPAALASFLVAAPPL